MTQGSLEPSEDLAANLFLIFNDNMRNKKMSTCSSCFHGRSPNSEFEVLRHHCKRHYPAGVPYLRGQFWRKTTVSHAAQHKRLLQQVMETRLCLSSLSKKCIPYFKLCVDAKVFTFSMLQAEHERWTYTVAEYNCVNLNCLP